MYTVALLPLPPSPPTPPLFLNLSLFPLPLIYWVILHVPYIMFTSCVVMLVDALKTVQCTTVISSDSLQLGLGSGNGNIFLSGFKR